MEVVLAVNHSETVLELKSEISLLSSELEKLLDVVCHESHEVGCRQRIKSLILIQLDVKQSMEVFNVRMFNVKLIGAMKDLRQFVKQVLYLSKAISSLFELHPQSLNEDVSSHTPNLQFNGNEVSQNIFFEGFTSIPTALTTNGRNRRIQVYQANDG